jgi:hypothetical protein
MVYQVEHRLLSTAITASETVSLSAIHALMIDGFTYFVSTHLALDSGCFDYS